MPLVTKPKISTSFSFSTGSWLKWDEGAPVFTQGSQDQRATIKEEESEETQSIDSDHSDDFWHNFNPQFERMIIARRATYLKELR